MSVSSQQQPVTKPGNCIVRAAIQALKCYGKAELKEEDLERDLCIETYTGSTQFPCLAKWLHQQKIPFKWLVPKEIHKCWLSPGFGDELAATYLDFGLHDRPLLQMLVKQAKAVGQCTPYCHEHKLFRVGNCTLSQLRQHLQETKSRDGSPYGGIAILSVNAKNLEDFIHNKPLLPAYIASKGHALVVTGITDETVNQKDAYVTTAENKPFDRIPLHVFEYAWLDPWGKDGEAILI